MKRNLVGVVLAALIAILGAPAVWAQMGTVKGVAKDFEGKPIIGGVVQFLGKESGGKYELKTDKKGEFFSLGIRSGPYRVVLLKDGKELFYFDPIIVSFGEEKFIDFDLSKQKAAQQAQMSEQQKKEIEAAQKENLKIKGLNQKLAEAAEAQQAGNFDQAIAVLTETTQMDPTRDLLWYKLADAERLGAAKSTDAADRTAKYQKAIQDYKKAIELKTASGAGGQQLGAYYNNLGEAYAKAGNTAEAAAAYNQAAQTDPQNAGQYFFNLGAVLTNTGKVDDAIQAFDKATAADPNRADAYYWKGINLLGKATLKGGKMEAPPGTAEAFNKYLELQPNGPYAQPAKDMLASIGAEIETSFGKAKAKKK